MIGAGYIVVIVIVIGLALTAIALQALSDHNRQTDFINKNLRRKKTMNEYLKQAQDFLTKHESTVEFHFLGKRKYFEEDTEQRNVYNVIISRCGKKDITITFGDSINNTRKKIKPTAFDVLACLQKYPVEGDVFDFADEFGYSIGDRKSYLKAFKIYDVTREEYEKVCSIFGDCLEELREIQ